MSRHVIFKHFDVSSNYKTQKNDVYLITNVQQPFLKRKNLTNSIVNFFYNGVPCKNIDLSQE
jgi:hypothetical protein